MPQIELAVRNANQARGMFYSGSAIEAETKAKADLLAKLAAEQAQEEADTAQQERAIGANAAAAETSAKAAGRESNRSLLGAGLGTATMLGGLYAMRDMGGGASNVVSLGDGKYGRISGNQITPLSVGGAPVAVPPASSMWVPALQNLGAGAAGGGGGYLAAQAVNAGGKNTALASGLGGLFGGGLGLMAGNGNPWLTGLGALAGSFGGGLLGNLFK